MAEALRTKRKSTFLNWLGWAHFLGLAVWFCIDLLRTLLFAVRSWGWLSGISDAVVIYRLGEALIALPLCAYLLAAGLRPDLLRRLRWLIWAGALLAGLSFPGLQERIGWAVLALVLAGLGLLAPWLATPAASSSMAMPWPPSHLLHRSRPLPGMRAGSRTCVTWAKNWPACTRTPFIPYRKRPIGKGYVAWRRISPISAMHRSWWR